MCSLEVAQATAIIVNSDDATAAKTYSRWREQHIVVTVSTAIAIPSNKPRHNASAIPPVVRYTHNKTHSRLHVGHVTKITAILIKTQCSVYRYKIAENVLKRRTFDVLMPPVCSQKRLAKNQLLMPTARSAPTSATEPSLQLAFESGTICRRASARLVIYSRFRQSLKTSLFGR